MAFFGKLTRKFSRTSLRPIDEVEKEKKDGLADNSGNKNQKEVKPTGQNHVGLTQTVNDSSNKRLYISESSPNCRATWLYIIMNNLNWPITDIDNPSEDLKKIIRQKSPLGIIPILQDGNLIICGCQSIIFYLSEMYSNFSYVGKTPEERARVESVICWSQNSLTRSAYHDVTGPQLHEDLSIGESENPCLVSHGKEQLQFHLDTLENTYLESQKYLLGDHVITMADIYTVMALSHLQSVLFDFTAWPKVCRWFQDVNTYINKTINETKKLKL